MQQKVTQSTITGLQFDKLDTILANKILVGKATNHIHIREIWRTKQMDYFGGKRWTTKTGKS